MVTYSGATKKPYKDPYYSDKTGRTETSSKIYSKKSASNNDGSPYLSNRDESPPVYYGGYTLNGNKETSNQKTSVTYASDRRERLKTLVAQGYTPAQAVNVVSSEETGTRLQGGAGRPGFINNPRTGAVDEWRGMELDRTGRSQVIREGRDYVNTPQGGVSTATPENYPGGARAGPSYATATQEKPRGVFAQGERTRTTTYNNLSPIQSNLLFGPPTDQPYTPADPATKERPAYLRGYATGGTISITESTPSIARENIKKGYNKVNDGANYFIGRINANTGIPGFAVHSLDYAGQTFEEGGAKLARRGRDNISATTPATNPWASAYGYPLQVIGGKGIQTLGEFWRGTSDQAKNDPVGLAITYGTAYAAGGVFGAATGGAEFGSIAATGAKTRAAFAGTAGGLKILGAGAGGVYLYSEGRSIINAPRPGERAVDTAVALSGFAAGAGVGGRLFDLPSTTTVTANKQRFIISEIGGAGAETGTIGFRKFGRSYELPYTYDYGMIGATTSLGTEAFTGLGKYAGKGTIRYGYGKGRTVDNRFAYLATATPETPTLRGQREVFSGFAYQNAGAKEAVTGIAWGEGVTTRDGRISLFTRETSPERATIYGRTTRAGLKDPLTSVLAGEPRLPTGGRFLAGETRMDLLGRQRLEPPDFLRGDRTSLLPPSSGEMIGRGFSLTRSRLFGAALFPTTTREAVTRTTTTNIQTFSAPGSFLLSSTKQENSVKQATAAGFLAEQPILPKTYPVTRTTTRAATMTPPPTPRLPEYPGFGAPVPLALPLMGGTGYDRRGRASRAYQYAPSLTAIFGGVTTSRRQSAFTTGFGIRPLMVAPKRRRKRRGKR